MSKILVIGVGNTGRNMCKKLKDDGLSDAEFVTFGRAQDDDRDDIPNHNLIEMSGYRYMSAGHDERPFKEFAEKSKDEIKEILVTLLDENVEWRR